MFASGSWTAFWASHPDWAPPSESAHILELDFTAGRVTGRGTDWVGEFTIDGHYDAAGRVSYTKSYIGKHSIEYSGKRNADGTIAGAWLFAGIQGGFFLLVPRPLREAISLAEPWHRETVAAHKEEFARRLGRPTPPVPAKGSGCLSLVLVLILGFLWRWLG
jgi:hypothetical protein